MTGNRKSGPKTAGRTSTGQFAAGNPGKPRGTRHKATQAALALLDGEAGALTRKAVEMALDAAKAAGAVLEAVAAGELTPTEGAHLMALVETYRRTLETTELEARVAALENGK